MTKTKKTILIVGLVVMALGIVEVINLFFGIESPLVIGPGWSVHKYVPTYEVYKGDKLIATIKPKPGPIVSTAAPLPPGQQITHSFLTATAFVPEEENNLYLLLQKAKDFNDYVNLLKTSGYVVKINHP